MDSPPDGLFLRLESRIPARFLDGDFRRAQLTGEIREDLRRLAREAEDGRVRRYAEVFLRYAEGAPRTEAATALSVSLGRFSALLRRITEEGAQVLATHNYWHRWRNFPPALLAELKEIAVTDRDPVRRRFARAVQAYADGAPWRDAAAVAASSQGALRDLVTRIHEQGADALRTHKFRRRRYLTEEVLADLKRVAETSPRRQVRRRARALLEYASERDLKKTADGLGVSTDTVERSLDAVIRDGADALETVVPRPPGEVITSAIQTDLHRVAAETQDPAVRRYAEALVAYARGESFSRLRERFRVGRTKFYRLRRAVIDAGAQALVEDSGGEPPPEPEGG